MPCFGRPILFQVSKHILPQFFWTDLELTFCKFRTLIYLGFCCLIFFFTACKIDTISIYIHICVFDFYYFSLMDFLCISAPPLSWHSNMVWYLERWGLWIFPIFQDYLVYICIHSLPHEFRMRCSNYRTDDNRILIEIRLNLWWQGRIIDIFQRWVSH